MEKRKVPVHLSVTPPLPSFVEVSAAVLETESAFGILTAITFPLHVQYLQRTETNCVAFIVPITCSIEAGALRSTT
jgi:hypothetical protein